MSGGESGTEFVANLAIPEPHEYANLTAIVGDERAASLQTAPVDAEVICGCLCCFGDGLTAQRKMDVTNSILLAQLAANKAFDRFQKPVDWYNSHSEILSNIGWNIPATSFAPFASTTVDIANMDQAVVLIAKGLATADEVAVLAAAVNAAKSRPTDSSEESARAVRIWNANSSNGSDANFQIMLVTSTGGSVTGLVIGYAFRATLSQIRFLSWGANPEIRHGVAKIELNSSIYDPIREQIVSKLAGKASTFVAAL